ncbi:MAG: TIGR01906 family membrane protein [Christensenellaceae bacterium]
MGKPLGAAIKKRLTSVFACVAAVLIILSTAVACIQTFAFNKDFYKQEYQKLRTSAYVGVSETTLFAATDTLLDYLQNKQPNLHLQKSDGQPFYNDREVAHMADVKVLYQNTLTFMMCGFAVGAVLVVLCFVLQKKAALSHFLRAYFWSAIGILAIFACIGIFAAVDFNNFWIGFHKLFFTNDLWMLDPETSLMIRMFEETFFFDLVSRILILFLGITCATTIISGIVYKRMKKHEYIGN